MASSVFSPAVQSVFNNANTITTKNVAVNGQPRPIQTPFRSPEDWRDQWIYFIMVDRFNNPQGPPRTIPFDAQVGTFQGGTFEGIRARLDYIKNLGVGAIWLSPVLKNCQFDLNTFHGYGIQDFVQVEPRFASNVAAAKANPQIAENELRALIDEVHAMGMYVIFDIVLNHTGNVFGYVVNGQTNASEASFQDHPYQIMWHDQNGNAAFPDIRQPPAVLSDDAAVWPVELHNNAFFRRQGQAADVPRAIGDFQSLKQMVSESLDVDRILIRAYQYIIAKFDVDGFRIDTFKVPDPHFGHVFCNSMREFALSIGKKNFFTFGEITVNEQDFPQFIGRDAQINNDEPIGIDAALDFPLEGTLGDAVKSRGSPASLVQMYQRRQQFERTVISTHGEASGFFVTFLDNHDRHQRFYFQDAVNPHRWDGQLTVALACLFSLQGIPCVYYGTEQGLHGIGNSDRNVREAFWGKNNPFDQAHPFYKATKEVAQVRSEQPALRYGRQYFRQISGNGVDFAFSTFVPGVLAFSRILDSQEVLVIANPSETQPFAGEVIVDSSLNAAPGTFKILFSNNPAPQAPGLLTTINRGKVNVQEFDGSSNPGPVRVLPVSLQPLEVQMLRR